MVMDIRVMVIAGQGTLKGGDRQVELSGFCENAAQIDASLDEVLVDLDGIVIPLACGAQIPGSIEEFRKLKSDFGMGAVLGQDHPIPFDRLLELPCVFVFLGGCEHVVSTQRAFGVGPRGARQIHRGCVDALSEGEGGGVRVEIPSAVSLVKIEMELSVRTDEFARFPEQQASAIEDQVEIDQALVVDPTPEVAQFALNRGGFGAESHPACDSLGALNLLKVEVGDPVGDANAPQQAHAVPTPDVARRELQQSRHHGRCVELLSGGILGAAHNPNPHRCIDSSMACLVMSNCKGVIVMCPDAKALRSVSWSVLLGGGSLVDQ